jgi:hypothetical protein
LQEFSHKFRGVLRKREEARHCFKQTQIKTVNPPARNESIGRKSSMWFLWLSIAV